MSSSETHQKVQNAGKQIHLANQFIKAPKQAKQQLNHQVLLMHNSSHDLSDLNHVGGAFA